MEKEDIVCVVRCQEGAWKYYYMIIEYIPIEKDLETVIMAIFQVLDLEKKNFPIFVGVRPEKNSQQHRQRFSG